MGPDYWLASPWRTARHWLRHWWRNRRTSPDWTPLDPEDTYDRRHGLL